MGRGEGRGRTGFDAVFQRMIGRILIDAACYFLAL